MATSTNAAARRLSARPAPNAPSAPRRPTLRVVERTPRRRASPGTLRRSTVWAGALMVVASLLAVVAGDAMVAEGQVRLTTVRSQVAAAEGVQKAAQVSVAEKAAPPVVVAQAKTQGLVAPQMVVYLPQVPLNVPLPVPQTAPIPPKR